MDADTFSDSFDTSQCVQVHYGSVVMLFLDIVLEVTDGTIKDSLEETAFEGTTIV